MRKELGISAGGHTRTSKALTVFLCIQFLFSKTGSLLITINLKRHDRAQKIFCIMGRCFLVAFDYHYNNKENFSTFCILNSVDDIIKIHAYIHTVGATNISSVIHTSGSSY